MAKWKYDPIKVREEAGLKVPFEELHADMREAKDRGSMSYDELMKELNEATKDIPSSYRKLEGRKDDQEKVRLELLTGEFLFAIATIMTFGANKYDAWNWSKGMKWSRVFGALMRHLWAWYMGKGPAHTNFAFGEIDAETGHSHLWHAGCCLMFLITYEMRDIGEDDRPWISTIHTPGHKDYEPPEYGPKEPEGFPFGNRCG